MEPDSYQIEVLHFINPHLIWIEVVPSLNGDYKFEQVGVYGLMPMEVTIDLDEGCVKGQESLEWTPAICKLMTQIFRSAAEVWFRPVFIDRSSSIFDNNIHKYGEFTIQLSDGKKKDLSKLLTKSCFAYENTKAFLNAFASSNLKTKLNLVETKAVVKILEKSNPKDARKSWEKSFKRHTTVMNAANKFENALTESNLDRHNRLSAVIKDNDVGDIIQRKMKDFELCKGEDEESVGRGVTRKLRISNENFCAAQNLKKLESNDLMKDFADTKKILLKLAKVKVKDEHEGTEYNVTLKEDKEVDNAVEELKPVLQREMLVEPPSTVAPSAWQHFRKKPKKRGPKLPEYDTEKEVLIVIGPPEIDQKTLLPKVIPKTEEFHGFGDKAEEEKIEAAPSKNMLAGLDSDSDVSCTYRKSNKLSEKIKLFSETSAEQIYNSDKNLCEKLSEKLSLLKLQHNLNTSNNFVGEENVSKDIKKVTTETKINDSVSSTDSDRPRITKSIMKRVNMIRSVNTDSSTDTTAKDSTDDSKTYTDSDTETTFSKIVEQLDLKPEPVTETKVSTTRTITAENNVNPFKNVDQNISKFVERLITRVLLLHSSNNKRLQPVYEIRDVNFNKHIHSMLTRNSIKHPMNLQSVSWFAILRGYSVFMVSPLGSGKTLGYVPAVCRLVADFEDNEIPDSVGPVCIIVCGTTKSALEVEKLCRMFLETGKNVCSYYPGVDEMEIIAALLNGCHLLVCTPLALVRLLNRTDFGVDLKRLNTVVMDDFERLNEVYLNEVKYFQLKIKEMLKARANKELKVQLILASRIWCDSMEAMVKKTPNALICIGSYQECVIYSKTSMSINFVEASKKLDLVHEFLDSIDRAKRTVIVCRTDEEVDYVEAALKRSKCSVFAANNKMTVEELYTLSSSWADYEEPLKGPILVCCDGNLTHLNITNAHYLLQYSLPSLFSMFSRRFSVLIDNYPSIFRRDQEVVKIKILLESENVEQLPKILHFIRRCEQNLPEALNEICARILKEKDLAKAQNLVPICDNMLGLGECPDFWNCNDRHSVIEEFDQPSDWMPKTGLVTFNILHYHSAVKYSARLISNIANGKATRYPQTYSSLSLKMGLYYSKESNRKLQGIPKVGDVCAVALKDNFFARCQVIKILSRHDKNGQPNLILVKLIDEEKWETAKDVYLYHLPDELKRVNSHVALVRLANLQPKDKDVTYSNIAMGELRNMVEKHDDLYVRARVVTTIGNSIIVDTLEACQDLSSSKDTVVRYNLKEELLKRHAILNPDHLTKLEILAPVKVEVQVVEKRVEAPKVVKPKPTWAFLQSDDFQIVVVTYSESPDSFFVRLKKFDDYLEQLEKDIQKYAKESEPIKYFNVGDFVLAKSATTSMYQRARIESVDKQKCFFVDHGDWGEVDINDMYEIPDKFVTVMPFQAIECRLTGIEPPREDWSEYSINWFCDQCIEGIDLKSLNAKYFTTEEAKHTGGYKYGIVLVDRNGDNDVVINNVMLELNLARQVIDQADFVKDLNIKREAESCESDWEEEYERHKAKIALKKEKLIRSVPLVNSDDMYNDDRWDVEIYSDQYIEPKSPVASNSSSKVSDFEVVAKPKIEELDSDDLSSVESNFYPENIKIPKQQIEVQALTSQRRPKLTWRQKANSISIRIELIGVEKYDLKIEPRHILFKTSYLDTDYGFEYDLYGVVDVEKCYHECRGQCIFVRLIKVLKKNWLSLTKDDGLNKSIVYDPDSMEASSSEEDVETKSKSINMFVKWANTMADDGEDFYDDSDII